MPDVYKGVGEGSVRGLAEPSTLHIERFRSVALPLAKHLHGNGHSTDDTVAAIDQWRIACSCECDLLIGWDRIEVLISTLGEEQNYFVCRAAATEINLNRVSTILASFESLKSGITRTDEFLVEITKAAHLPPHPLWLFAAAAAVGAVALAVIFGEAGPAALAAIAGAAGVGAIVRRALAMRGIGLFFQNFAAAFIAGLMATAGVRLGLSSDFEVASACPCMILIPGPHLLNGLLDLLFSRVPLGASRLIFAAVGLTAISAGLLGGLILSGRMLPMHGVHAAVPFLVDVVAGGLAATCFAVFYNTPSRMLVWPAVIGAISRAIDWWSANQAGMQPARAVLLASLVAGTLLIVGGRRIRLPFSGIGFASVVSMMPGIFVFPMASALVAVAQHGPHSNVALVSGVVSDGTTAFLVVLAMAIGLLSPKSFADVLLEKQTVMRRDRLSQNAPA